MTAASLVARDGSSLSCSSVPAATLETRALTLLTPVLMLPPLVQPGKTILPTFAQRSTTHIVSSTPAPQSLISHATLPTPPVARSHFPAQLHPQVARAGH